MLIPDAEPGDRIRVTRTTVRVGVYEGYLRDEIDPAHTGDQWIDEDDGSGRRIRTNGPVKFATGDPAEYYTETDDVEVLEKRNGAPYETANWGDVQRAKANEGKKQSWFKRLIG